MDYLLHKTPFDVDSPNAQDMLNAAHKVKQRVLCRCTQPMPEMYVARIADKFVIKRMPDTGPNHAPSCSSFLPPDELSGLSQVHGTAFEENPDDGTTLLRLGFPLSIRGKASAPPPSVTKASEVKSPDRKLTLTSLLHFLWHEADLTKWYPKMTGKRTWWVIRHELKAAAVNKIAKQQAFYTRLFVPENFKMDYKEEIVHDVTLSLKALAKGQNRQPLLAYWLLNIKNMKKHLKVLDLRLNICLIAISLQTKNF